MSGDLTDKIYLSDGLGWTVYHKEHKDRISDWISQAICPEPECRVRLEFGQLRETRCIKCGKLYKIDKDYETLRGEVGRKYDGSKYWMADVINLDLLPTKLSAEDSDDMYWLQVRLGQRNGKRTAAIFIGEKTPNQTKKDYAQLMVDLDDKGVRFDKGNMHPTKLLSKIEVEFEDSKTTIEKK